MFARYLLSFVLTSVVLCTLANAARAGFIVDNNAGTQSAAAGGIFGQSFTTPNGGPWDTITFNFINSVDGPVAAGGLYALSQQYSGAPTALSTSTPGFLGYTNVISGGQWQFSGLTLNSNTQYFFYMDSATTELLKFSFSNPHPGGAGANAVALNTNYLVVGGTFDFNFSVQGNVTAVPEPSSLALLSLAAGGFGLRGWRKRRKLRPVVGTLNAPSDLS